MKNSIKAILSIALLMGFVQPTFAAESSKPVVVSFTMTPSTIDVTSPNTLVTFNLVVSNPTGIASAQTQVTLSDGGSNSAVAQLTRTDSPIQSSLSTVTFRGTLSIPSNFSNGAYWATAKPVISLVSGGRDGYSTDILRATTTSTVVGAENALLIRKSGDLNYAYSTFSAPAYDKTLGTVFVDPKFNVVSDPIWKVGESFNPGNYYELKVPTLTLKVKTLTPSICSTDGNTLTLIKEGGCSYTVYTDKTSDYQLYQDARTVTITAARIKPNYFVGSIATQSSASLPLLIAGPYVFGINGYIIPVSATPSVCYPTGTYVNIISGGTCTLNYSTSGTSTYLQSDVYPLTFEITRSAQTVSFTTPPAASLSSKLMTLKASSSSGLPISFLTSTPTICSVTGSSLNLLVAGTCHITATQIGTATISPASVDQNIVITGAGAAPKGAARVTPKVAKKLDCVKNGKTQIVASKKCPTGYNPRR
jgi:hypothetical protein